LTFVLTRHETVKVNLTNYLASNQNVVTFDIVLIIKLKIQTKLIVEVQLCSIYSGKLKIGQSVNIIFSNYQNCVDKITIIRVKNNIFPGQRRQLFGGS